MRQATINTVLLAQSYRLPTSPVFLSTSSKWISASNKHLVIRSNQRPLKSLETLMTKLPSHYPHNNQFL
ncbi:hypothetical protein CFRS1_v014154 [Colletotrichum fructicola]|nr:hypothetical protein CFRS1_v014154 [Colletotrichum fructicola]